MRRVAPGDRVRYEPGDDVVQPFSGSWPGRLGWVVQVFPDAVRVRWDDEPGCVASTAARNLVAAGPDRLCSECGSRVYVGIGCLTGDRMEFVTQDRGLVALVGGIGKANDQPEAAAQAAARKMLGADPDVGRVTAHWRVCQYVPKYAS